MASGTVHESVDNGPTELAAEPTTDKQYGSDSETILEDMKRLELEKKKIADLEQQPSPPPPAATAAAGASNAIERDDVESVEVVSKPTVIEDFIRNFLISNEMHDALDVFQREWYNKLQGGDAGDEMAAIAAIPDIYVQRERLSATVKTLRGSLERMESVTRRVKGTWDGLRKERDFHRMHHRRVAQEKKELLKQLKRLKKYCDSLEPTISALRTKYEAAAKEKMLFRIDRDKMAVKMDAMEEQIRNIEQNHIEHPHRTSTANKHSDSGRSLSAKTQSLPQRRDAKRASSSSTKSKASKSTTAAAAATTTWPTFSGTNPFQFGGGQQLTEPVALEKLTLHKTLSVGEHAVSSMALHPTKDIVATASDDMSWKLWNLPSGQLIMAGEGHKDWVSAASFDPAGAHLATSSGDGTIKIWDFLGSRCLTTLEEHTSVVWDCRFHFEAAQFVASCSMDHTVKLWDVEHSRCRQTYRGHVDSVNCVAFQPFSNHIVSASGDKTISFWDCRSALCVQTFYGHRNSINHVAFNRRSDAIASCDADGIVKVWDIRMIRERTHIDCGKLEHPAAHCLFDAADKRLVVASHDALLKVYDAGNGQLLGSLAGHQDAVNAAVLSHDGKAIVSVSSDATLRVWQ